MSDYTISRTCYAVEVSHPTGFHKGRHVVIVTTRTNGNNVVRYCTGDAFGCSRDYVVRNDKDAIAAFLAEHACRVVETTRSRK